MQGPIGTTHCPNLACGAPMVRRRERYGQREEFYGCTEYPRCRETLPISERERMLALGAPGLPGFDEELD